MKIFALTLFATLFVQTCPLRRPSQQAPKRHGFILGETMAQLGPKGLISVLRSNPGKAVWTGLCLLVLAFWLRDEWANSPSPGAGQSALMILLTFPSGLAVAWAWVELGRVLDVSFYDLGRISGTVGTWVLLYVGGYLQWFVLLPRALTKLSAALREKDQTKPAGGTTGACQK